MSSRPVELDVHDVTALLAAEYPLLDSTLILAIVSDHDPSTLGARLPEIRDQLAILEATLVPDPDEHNVPEEVPLSQQEEDDDQLPPIGRLSLASESSRPSTSKNGTSKSHSSSDKTSSSSTPSEHDLSLTDEVEHLTALFPDTPVSAIKEALNTQPDLGAATDYLLSVEAIREAERHGYFAGEKPSSDSAEWATVAPRRSPPSAWKETIPSGYPLMPVRSTSSSRQKKKKKKGVTIPVIDTLQRQTPLPSRPTSRNSSRPASGKASRDSSPARKPPLSAGVNGPAVWDTLASLAGYLSELVPTHQPSFFLSYLHSPDYRSAYSAIRAALAAIPASPKRDSDEISQAVFEDIYGVSLLDNAGDPQAHRDLILCTRVARMDVSNVMDLMDLLGELSQWPSDTNDFERFDLASSTDSLVVPPKAPPITALKAPAATTSPSSWDRGRVQKRTKQEPKERKERIVPGSAQAAALSSTHTATDNFGLPYASQLVVAKYPHGAHPDNWRSPNYRPPRRSTTAHPYASHIPAYGRGQLPNNPAPNSLFAGPSAAPSAAECLRRAQAERVRRSEAVRAATRHLAGGKAVQGSVAGYYTLQAREAGDRGKQWELQAAQMIVNDQLKAGNTIDLHHMTIDEAVSVSLQAAARWYARERETSSGREGANKAFAPSSELRIVTGVGRHSAGGVGVLGPAVSSALERAGWRVSRGDASGYLIVRGKR